MKKTILIFIILLSTTAVFCQPVDRQKVVFEIGTATWCPYCPGASMGAKDLIENGHDVAIIKYHGGDDFENSHSSYRNNYYNILSFPTTIIDGIEVLAGGSQDESLYPHYLDYYNLRKDIPSPFTIDINLEKTGNFDYGANILVTEVCDDYSSGLLVLHFAITETDIPHNWQNQTHIEDALRKMVPNQHGTIINFSKNNEQLIDLSFTLEESWVQDNMSVIVFIQDRSTKEILQANTFELKNAKRGLVLIDNEDNYITGDTIKLAGLANDEYLKAEIFFRNNTTEEVAVFIKKTEAYIMDGTNNTFCWDGVCYPPNVYEVEEPIILGPDETSTEDDFYTQYFPNGIEGESIIDYEFFSKDDSFESVVVTVIYTTESPNFIAPQALSAGALSEPKPNPAINYTKIYYQLPTGTCDAYINIINTTGLTVKKIALDHNNDFVKINTSILKNGVFFYSLVVNGKTISTKKLVVK